MAAIPQGMFAARKVRANMNSGWERSLLSDSLQQKPETKQEQNTGGSSWGRQQSGGSKDNSWGSTHFPKLNQQCKFKYITHSA
jgi:hypothetical protein